MTGEFLSVPGSAVNYFFFPCPIQDWELGSEWMTMLLETSSFSLIGPKRLFYSLDLEKEIEQKLPKDILLRFVDLTFSYIEKSKKYHKEKYPPPFIDIRFTNNSLTLKVLSSTVKVKDNKENSV